MEITSKIEEIYYLKRYRLLKRLAGKNRQFIHEDDLKVCLNRKFIFVHIPKTAGKSIRKVLFGKGYNACHANAAELKRVFPRKGRDFFTFCFVRNPWDRLLSAYLYLVGGGNQFRQDRLFASEELGAIHDFEDFVLNWLSPEKIHSYIHFVPQAEFVFSGGDAQVDFIGKFEEIDKDFAYVASKIGVANTISHDNKSNRPENKPYFDCYSIKMIDIVAKIYQQDIQSFQYTFK